VSMSEYAAKSLPPLVSTRTSHSGTLALMSAEDLEAKISL
jgi:hypothetical protein